MSYNATCSQEKEGRVCPEHCGVRELEHCKKRKGDGYSVKFEGRSYRNFNAEKF